MFKNIVKYCISYLIKLYFEKFYHAVEHNKSLFFTDKIRGEISSFGRGSHVKGKIEIVYPKGLIIGDNVSLSKGSFFDCRGNIIINDHTIINSGASILSSYRDHEEGLIPSQNGFVLDPVIIERNVSIERNVTIYPGVTIGEGVILKAGSVITESIPPNITVYPKFHSERIERDLRNSTNIKEPREIENRNPRSLTNDGLNAHLVSKVFILSTGRSGSNAIAKILNQNLDIEARHESFSFLIRLSNEYLYGRIDKKRMKEIIKKTFSSFRFKEPVQLYCESDQKLAAVIEPLSELYPDAKFIWLIRDPKKVVSSTYFRGWFSNEELNYPSQREEPEKYASKFYSKYRLNGYLANEFDLDEWKSMHPFERNCWYWFYWNKLIENQLAKINNSRMVVDLDQLDEKISNLTRFIGVSSSTVKTVKSNQAKYKVTDQKDWEPEWLAYYEKWCQPYYQKIRHDYMSK